MLFMRQAQKSLLRTRLRAFAVTALMAMGVAVATDRVGTAEESAAYTIEVSDVTAKVASTRLCTRHCGRLPHPSVLQELLRDQAFRGG